MRIKTDWTIYSSSLFFTTNSPHVCFVINCNKACDCCLIFHPADSVWIVDSYRYILMQSATFVMLETNFTKDHKMVVTCFRRSVLFLEISDLVGWTSESVASQMITHDVCTSVYHIVYVPPSRPHSENAGEKNYTAVYLSLNISVLLFLTMRLVCCLCLTLITTSH